MTRYSVHPTDNIFARGYEFLSFAKYMGRNIDKNVSKKFSGKYRKIHLKLLLKKAIQETADATDDLTGNKIADKITKLSKTPPQNNSETVESKICNSC